MKIELHASVLSESCCFSCRDFAVTIALQCVALGGGRLSRTKVALNTKENTKAMQQRRKKCQNVTMTTCNLKRLK